MIKYRFLITAFIAALLLTACSPKTPAATPTPDATPTPTEVQSTPTPTPQPLALRVNGEEISLADYNLQLEQLQSAAEKLEMTLTPEEERQRVLDTLMDETLLAQYAASQGMQFSQADVQARLEKLTAEAGGADAMSKWQAEMGYDAASFQRELQRAMLASAGRDAIIALVPETAEQVHARQILLLNEATASSALSQLKVGGDFTTLAFAYDPLAGGDLGWFPRNFLTQPEVEAAAFALQPGQYSDIIKTSFGYHIIYIIEREAEHALSLDARRALQRTALSQWLQTRRAESDIEVLLP